MKEQSLMTSTLLLTTTSFITRTISMISIIFLSNLLGAGGIGIYELIMSVYTTAVAFASAGISISISKLVAEELGQKSLENVGKVMGIAFIFSLSLSTFVSTSLFILAPFLANNIIHDLNAVTGLRILSLSIPFISLSSCFKGYFYATKKTFYPASADVIEQCTKMALILTLVNIYFPKGSSYGYGAIGMGLTIGEVVSFTYLFTLFIRETRLKKRDLRSFYRSSSSAYHFFMKLLSVLIPIASISYISYLFMCMENTLIPLGLEKFGTSLDDSMAMYGVLKGMVLPILFFPSAFLTAFSTTLVPEIARANVLRLKERVVTTTNRVLQLTLLLSILVVSIFLSYSDEIGMVIYNNSGVGPMLSILCLIVPFVYVEVVTDGILKGLGQQLSCLKYSMIDSICRIILIYTLLPFKGMNAFIGIMVLSCILSSTLNFTTLRGLIPIKFNFSNWLFKPILAGTGAGYFSRAILRIYDGISLSLKSKLILEIILSIVIYIVILWMIECFSKEDVRWLKKHLPFIR